MAFSKNLKSMSGRLDSARDQISKVYTHLKSEAFTLHLGGLQMGQLLAQNCQNELYLVSGLVLQLLPGQTWA